MRIMNILFIGINGHEYPHTRVRCYQFAEQLAKYPGIRTSVLSFRDHLSDYNEVEIYNLRDRDRLRLTWRALPKLLKPLNTLFYVHKIHYHAALPFFLHRLGAYRYILDYDDYDVDLMVSFKHSLLNRLFFGSNDPQAITQQLATHALGCVASSKYLMDYLKQFNENVGYISTGTDTTKFPFINRQDKPRPVTFLWNGVVWRDEILQSLLLTLRSFQRVVRLVPEVHLKIVGDGPFMEQVDRGLKDEFSDITRHVERIPWVESDQMPYILAGADIGLVPLVGDNPWVNCRCPITLFEYMASGMPTIAFNVGEVSNVIHHEVAGLLAVSELEFSHFMVKLAQNDAYRLWMGQNAAAIAHRRFSIPFLVEKLYWYIMELLRY